MLSGYDDSYRTFSNNVSAPWVTGTTVTVDENLMKWVEQTKTYTDNGYNNKSSLWSDVWAADQGPDGKVFGFFYSTWGINFTLLGNSLETPRAAKPKRATASTAITPSAKARSRITGAAHGSAPRPAPTTPPPLRTSCAASPATRPS